MKRFFGGEHISIYISMRRGGQRDNAFDENLIALRKQIEDDININELSKSAQNKAEKYLCMSRRGDNIRISFNETACKAAKKYSAKNLKLEKKLKSWLENTPIYGILQWFDTVEGVKVSSKLMTKRCSTEITERDALFLAHLGVSVQVDLYAYYPTFEILLES